MTLTAKQIQAAKWLTEALAGNAESKHKLAEGISTSDIPVQLTPALSYIALQAYEEVVRIWPKFAGKETVPDFESNPYYRFEWSDDDIEASNAGTKFIQGGLPRIPEYGEYPVLRFNASDLTIKTAKSGVQIKYSWESLHKTRNFGMLRRTFVEFGKRAAKQEDIEATKILVDVNGPNAKYWNATNQNVVTGNPVLSMESLQAAFEQIALQTSEGVRISVPSQYVLVVPPTLETVANDILAVQKVTKQVVSGGVTETTESGNPVSGKIREVVVNNYLAQIAGTNADTAWFLIPVVGSTPNPNVVNVFLEGNESPKIFVQRTTVENPEDGAFIDDSYSTKTRHIVLGGFIDPAATIASAGK